MSSRICFSCALRGVSARFLRGVPLLRCQQADLTGGQRKVFLSNTLRFPLVIA